MMRNEANTTGNRFERMVEDVIKHDGYILVPENRYSASKGLSQKIYSKQFPLGKSIYDTNRKVDFILFNSATERELVIECKWQDVPGSVDEKYPFTVLNIKKLNVDTIIILDGNGYKPKAKQWLEEQVGGCLIGVMSFAEFSKKVRVKNLL